MDYGFLELVSAFVDPFWIFLQHVIFSATNSVFHKKLKHQQQAKFPPASLLPTSPGLFLLGSTQRVDVLSARGQEKKPLDCVQTSLVLELNLLCLDGEALSIQAGLDLGSAS